MIDPSPKVHVFLECETTTRKTEFVMVLLLGGELSPDLFICVKQVYFYKRSPSAGSYTSS